MDSGVGVLTCFTSHVTVLVSSCLNVEIRQLQVTEIN